MQPASTQGITILPLSDAAPISSEFWGINVEPDEPFNVSDAQLLATTPVTYIRFPGGAEADWMNYTSGVITNKTGYAHLAVTPVSEFVGSCEAIHCHAILSLPAEIDNPATAAYYVSYVEHTLDFTPAYWEVGNEPAVWPHYDQPWSTWGTAPKQNATIPEYTALLRNYTVAIRSVDPSTPIVAPALGEGSSDGITTCSTWCGPVVAADGAEIAAVSVHSKAAFPVPRVKSVQSFFSLLEASPYALPTVVPEDRAIIANNYSGHLPLFITEDSTIPFTTGGETTFATYTGEFYGGLFLAAETTQLLALDVANVDWYTWASVGPYAWDGSGDGPLNATGQVFQTFMSQLDHEYDPTTVAGPSTVYAAATTDGTNLSLLVVNVNITEPYSFPLSSLFSGMVNETSWAYGSSITTTKVANTTGTALPLSVSVWRGHGFGSSQAPPLLTAVAVAPSPVSVPTGMTQPFFATPTCTPDPCPSGVTYSWSLTNRLGNLTSDAGSNVTFLAGATAGIDTLFVNGTLGGVTIQSSPIPVTIVAPSPRVYPVTFTETGLPSMASWSVTLGESTESATNSSLQYTETNGTYDYTVGEVAGYDASPSIGSVAVDGTAATVTIHFVGAGPALSSITFREVGLEPGTLWHVTLDGTTNSSTTGAVSFSVINGSHQYSIGSPAGYGSSPSNGTVSSSGTPLSVAVNFSKLYVLTFSETSLPAGTNWSVTLTGEAAAIVLLSADGNDPIVLTRWSDGAVTVQFNVSSGNYSYSATAGAYSTVAGHVTVNGQSPAPATIAFSSSPSPSPGPPVLDYWILGAGLVAIALGALVVLLRGRRKAPPGS
jgi:hypothetical protein